MIIIKKIKIILTMLILFCLFITGCGSSKSDISYVNKESIVMDGAMVPSMDMGFTNGSLGDFEYSKNESFNDSYIEEDIIETTGNISNEYSQKMIRKVQLEIETTDLDKSVLTIKEKVNKVNGYIESSNFNKNPYSYLNGLKNQRLVIRVPFDNVDIFLEGIKDIGTVVNNNDSITDVTLSYTETKSRISSLEIEYSRLEELLSKANSLDVIIQLEDRLSDVRFELENNKASLRVMENLINHSTITISLREVMYETVVIDDYSFSQRIKNGLKTTMNELSEGFQEFIVNFIINFPFIVIYGIIIIVCIIIVKKIVKSKKRKNKRKDLEKFEENNKKER